MDINLHKLCYAIAVLMLNVMSASSYNDEDSRADHSFGFNIRPSYIMPTHGFYNGWNPMGKPLRVGGSLNLDYSFAYSPDSEISRKYPGAYQGIGLGVQTFLAHEYIGTPLMLYLFQGAPLVGINERLTLGYEWNLGLSGGWKRNETLVTGSYLNLYINVGLICTWKLTQEWDVIFGPEYTHFSNGDTRFPNAGANTVNFRLGARRHFNRPYARLTKSSIFTFSDSDVPFSKRVTYDLTAFGSWRSDRMIIDNRLHIINKAFPVAGMHFNPLYHFNHSLSAGASLDLMYDRSANLEATVDENDILTYSYPDFSRQISAGLSVRGELKMPIFVVNIGIGYNFGFKGSDIRGVYGIFALKSFMTDSFFLNIGYRLSSVLYSHNLMFGIGWRFL